MLELAGPLLPLLRDGDPVAVVTVAGVSRSAPRGTGASMAVTADGRIIGSISGGCVEGDAVALAHEARVTDAARTARLGFSDDAAHAAGLACGGSVDVVAYPLHASAAVLDALSRAAAGEPVSVGVIVDGDDAGRILDEDELGNRVDPGALGPLLARRESSMLGTAYGSAILVLSSASRPRLLLLGAGEHAAAICRIAAAAGFAVTVCDLWESLVTRERFPDADRLVVALPHDFLAGLRPDEIDPRTAICVLTHDERVDVPAIEAALALPVGFVGAMGARRTVAHRAARLRDRGVSEAALARLHSPLGLDLGGTSPDETAIAVLAEIVAGRHGGSGMPLRDESGPIHARAAPAGAVYAKYPSAPPHAERRQPHVTGTEAGTAGSACGAASVPLPARPEGAMT